MDQTCNINCNLNLSCQGFNNSDWSDISQQLIRMHKTRIALIVIKIILIGSGPGVGVMVGE